MKNKNMTTQTNEAYRMLGTVKVPNDTRKTLLNNNDMVLGSSGSGKTGGYVVPLLQNANESLVITDTKGLLHRQYSKLLKDRGYDIKVIDFVNPENSVGYNPLHGIRTYKNGVYKECDILTLANNIIPNLDSRDPFWQEAAKGYLSMLIAYAMNNFAPEERVMSGIFDLHNMFQTEKGKLVFSEYAAMNPQTYVGRKYKSIMGSINADKMWNSINEFVNRGLEYFIFNQSDYIFARPKSECLDIKSLGRKKTVVFLNVSDTDRSFDTAINMLYSQMFHLLCEEADSQPEGRLKVPVRIIMDDFATNAVIPNFDNIISVIRSREISVSLILQSLSQLDAMYGEHRAKTIQNNCDHILYLGTQDQSTAEFVSLKAKCVPEAVLTMPRDKAYLITSNEGTRLINKIMPYSTLERADMDLD